MPWFLTKNKFLRGDVTRRLSWKECCVARGFTNCCCLLCIKIRLLKGHLHHDDILLSGPESFRVSLVQISATPIQTSLALLNVSFAPSFEYLLVVKSKHLKKWQKKPAALPLAKAKNKFQFSTQTNSWPVFENKRRFQTQTPTPAQKQTISFENKFQSWKLTSSNFLKRIFL